jgi:hypothetical protein
MIANAVVRIEGHLREAGADLGAELPILGGRRRRHRREETHINRPDRISSRTGAEVCHLRMGVFLNRRKGGREIIL